MNRSLLAGTRRAVSVAAHAYRDRPAAAGRCAVLAERLDGPLRVALAGRVKAGKSTLLNALVGERVAPADVGECTRVVTWYRDGPEPRIMLQPRNGPPRALPVHRRDRALEIDLGGDALDVERLVVDWPAPDLQDWTVIDTPGVASLSADVSARAVQLLDPASGPDDGADAVIYLMRHVHAADVDLLKTLRGLRSPFVNAVAVLSRADEIGSGRTDALPAAAAVADRYRREPAVRGLCLDVVAVAGLLAETGRTLEAVEVAAVRTLAALPPSVLDEALRSADRFRAASSVELTPERRDRLLERLGMFGVRLVVRLVTEGTTDPAELGRELVRRSGLAELQASVATRLWGRRDVLVARSVLLGLRRLLRDEPAPGTAALAVEVGRLLRGAHELVELRALAALRAGDVALPPEAVGEGLALLGDAGPAVHARLRLPADRPDEECRARAAQAVHRFRAWAENPLADHAAAALCRTVVRTCEGIVADAGITSGAARRTR